MLPLSPTHPGWSSEPDFGPVTARHLNDNELRFLELCARPGDLILVVDPAGRILHANQAWRDLLGFPNPELDGLSIFDVTRRADHAICQAWLGQSGENPASVQMVFQACTGREIPVEGFTSARVEGQQARFLRGFFRDLTRQRQAETALQESAELFNLLTSHSPLGVFRVDAAGRLTYTSPHWRRIAGMVHVTQPRGVWWQMVDPQDRDRVLTEWHTAVQHSHEFSAEFRIHVPAAHERWCRVRISLSCDPEGAVRGGIGTTEDVTEYRQAAQALRRAHAELEDKIRARTAELEAANHELAEFAYVVSHDLKAPLRGVSLISEWLAQDYASRLGPDGVELFGKLRRRVQEMHALVDGVLAYTRIGHTVEEDVAVDLNQIVRQVLHLIGSPPEVQFNIPSSLPVVRGLPHQLIQVFQNLLDNAVKFLGRSDGAVTLHIQRRSLGWEFAVEDNGPGIDPRHHERIFQMFQRLNPDPKVPGSGIGLSLVKRVIEARGGRVSVESQEGKGTTFRFLWPDERCLPQPVASEAGFEPHEPPKKMGRRTRTPRVQRRSHP